MTHWHEEDLALHFPPGDPGNGQRSEAHHRSLRMLVATATAFGWTASTPDLGFFGRPDAVLVTLAGVPLAVEYKSYRHGDRHLLKTSVLQLAGYVAAIPRCSTGFLVLGGIGPMPDVGPIPASLGDLRIVTPGQFVDAVLDQYLAEGHMPPDPPTTRPEQDILKEIGLEP